MPTKPYTITPEKFASLPAQIREGGGSIDYAHPEDGDINDPSYLNAGWFFPPKHPEVQIGFVYDGKAVLTLTILDEAWYETAGEVWDGLAPYLS